MDLERRIASYSVIGTLRDEPYGYDFFQAVRRLECACADLPRVGKSERPDDDPVRFCQNVFLGFAPSALHAFSKATDEKPSRLMVNFFGLLGTNGPMPLSITEYVHDRLYNHGDKTLASFLDIFNHRMISLFYRAWACSQQTVGHDRAGDDSFAVYIGSLFGMGAESFRSRDAIPDIVKLHYAARLACSAKNAEGLREILQDYFGVEVDIEEFVGRWIDLPREYCCRLGESPRNGTVGSTLIVGSRFWECQQTFRVTFGPMNFADYQRMLPRGNSFRRFIAWIKNYVGDELRWQLQLILSAVEVPGLCLGQLGQLGWSTWLKSRKFERDAADLVLNGLLA